MYISLKLYQIVCRDWSQIIIIIIIILIIITIMINLKLKNEEGEGLVIIYSLVDRILEDQKVSQRGREGNQSSPTEHDSRRL